MTTPEKRQPITQTAAIPRKTPWDAAILSALGAVTALAAALLPWWKLIGAPAPVYVWLLRAATLFAGVVAAVAAIRRSGSAGSVAAAGWACVLLPLLLCLVITLLDARSISAAVYQQDQADRLWRCISATGVDPQVGWISQRGVTPSVASRNDYNLLDGLEAVSYFARAGWFLSLAAGLFLIVGAWMTDAAAVRRWCARWSGRSGLAVVALLVLAGGRQLLSYWYWNRAKSENGEGRYAPAIADMGRAAAWDTRLQGDLVYRFDLGRIEGHLGMLRSPDYLASAAEMLVMSKQPERAYSLLRNNLPTVLADPIASRRFTELLLDLGAADLNGGRASSAEDKLREACRLDGSNLESLYALAMAETAQGEYREAIGSWSGLINLNESVGLFGSKYVVAREYRKPITAAAWGRMGWCFYRLGDMARALQCDENSTRLGATAADRLFADDQ